LEPGVANEKDRGASGIQVFEYPATPGLSGPSGEQVGLEDLLPSEKESELERESSPSRGPEAVDFEQRLAEECRRSFEGGRDRGRQEALQEARDSYVAELKALEERRVCQHAELIENFSQARDSYLREVEREVVKLALEIAARILRREAHMDPLLLTGAVRVALGQLSESTEVKLLVPASELELWTAAIHLIPNLALQPAIQAGDKMRLGDCRIEAVQGSVDLGIRAQLDEIERGFFDGNPRPKPQARHAAERTSVAAS
jgi:flagellar assembly protein FliH